MKVIPHVLQFVGFFDNLNLHVLAQQIQSLVDSKEKNFSLNSAPNHRSIINCFCTLVTENESFVSKTPDEDLLIESLNQLCSQPWLQAEVIIEHGLITQHIGGRLLGCHNGERFVVKIDQEEGTCEIKCRLRDLPMSRDFLEQFIQRLNLSDKPVKFSREIPPWLETKLLCDSLHLCNICRGEGVVIHHIKPVESGGKTVEDNLIVICTNDHRRVHTKSTLAKGVRPEHLREYKKRHLQWVGERGANLSSQESPLPLNDNEQD